MSPGNDAERLARRIASGDRSPGTAAAYASSVGGGVSGRVWIAQMETPRRGGWIGVGSSEREARLALLERWLERVRELEEDPDWRREHGDDEPRTLEAMDDQYGVVTSRYTLGKGYVEKEEDDDELDRRLRKAALRKRRRSQP